MSNVIKALALFIVLLAGWSLALLHIGPLGVAAVPPEAGTTPTPAISPVPSFFVPGQANEPSTSGTVVPNGQVASPKPVGATSPVPELFVPKPAATPTGAPAAVAPQNGAGNSGGGQTGGAPANGIAAGAQSAGNAAGAPAGGSSTGNAVAKPAARVTPSPSRVEYRSFGSPALGRGMPYLIYLPPGYDTNPTRRYPVIYLLHGIGGGFGGENGSNTEWYGYGVTGSADKLIGNGQAEPFIIAFPQGDQSFFIDHADGPKWGVYTGVDFVKEVDTHFRTLADRDHRAIGGLSMGGFGALSLAMLYPNTFGAAGAHSSSFYTRDAAPFFGDQAFYDAHAPGPLLHAHPDVARTLKLWLDVGAQDPLWKAGDEAMHQQLVQDNIPHEWNEWPGAHDGVYWNAHMDDYVRFYAGAVKG